MRQQLRNLSLIAWKDTRILYRNPRAALINLVMPLVLIVFVSVALSHVLTGDVQLHVAVVDTAHTQQSEAVAGALGHAPQLNGEAIKWKASALTDQDAAAIMNRTGAIAVLAVSRIAGQPPTVNIIGGKTNVNLAGLVAGLAASGSERSSRLTVDGVPIALSVHAVQTHKASPYDQTVPGFTLMFSVYLAISVCYATAVERKYIGTWSRTMAGPVARPLVLAGPVIAVYSLAVAQGAILFLLGRFVFGMHVMNWPATIALLGAFLLFPGSLGLLLASMTDTPSLQGNVVSAVAMGCAILGGAIVPITTLPSGLRVVAHLTPHFWALSGLRSVMVGGAGFGSIAPRIAVLLAFAIVPFVVGTLRFHFRNYA
jgi:ABC-2 type transport system permease protein